MSDAQFFNGQPQLVTLGSPTLQSTSRRVCVPVRMALDGKSFSGMPEWVASAYQAVSRFLTEASPETQQVVDVVLSFTEQKPDGEMFTAPAAHVPGSELKGFIVTRVGDPEADPQVELHFKAYAPYSRKFWAWIGEMAGKEVFMLFPKGGSKPATPVQGALVDDEVPTAAEVAALKGDAKPKSAAKKKSGPKDLSKFHEKEVARGRA